MRETLGDIMRGVPVKDGTKAKRVANNTVHYIRPDGAEVWRLHHTDIVVKRPDGTYELNSGGWRTSTTKERINSYSPVRLGQSKGEWWLYVGEGQGWSEEHIPFIDGMRVDAGGKPIGYKPDKAAKEVAARAKLAKAINRFARLILDTEKFPDIPLPEMGDCFICQVEQPSPSSTGRVWNCANANTPPGGDTEHLLSHIEEGYLHGSLIFNALAWAGYKDPSFIMHRSCRDILPRAIRRYLRRRLGLG